MAANIGTTPERWLQELDRLVAATAALLPDISALRSRRERVSNRWVMERGHARVTAPVDVLGGFPGCLRWASRCERTSVIVTDRYLVLGEGAPDGFALPLVEIRAASVVRPSPQANPGLVIHFQDGPGVGTFALNFRGLGRGLSGRLRAEEVMGVLVVHGVRRLAPARICRSPQLALSWDGARRLANEGLVWAGFANAAVGGWYGAVHQPCRVWLTEASLFWCCPNGEGVNRLALSDIIGARDGVADRVGIAFRNASGDRYDLPFDFDAHVPGVSATQQRMGFLNMLAASGVAVSAAPIPLAPWQRRELVRPVDIGRFRPDAQLASSLR